MMRTSPIARDILVAHRNLLDDGYWPMTLHPTLIAKGIKLLSVPDMVVHHRGPFNFGYYLHQRFLFSRAFAGVRARNAIGRPAARLSGRRRRSSRRAAGRIARTVVRKRCRVGEFVATLPLTVPALIVLVAGEWVGCLLGPGNALIGSGIARMSEPGSPVLSIVVVIVSDTTETAARADLFGRLSRSARAAGRRSTRGNHRAPS